MSFLKINNLSVDYQMRRETVYAAKNVNIDVNKGEILGLVGESGSGKSTVGNAIINLIDEPGKISSGSITLGDINIHEDPKNIIKYRGKKIGLIFQDPQTSLSKFIALSLACLMSNFKCVWIVSINCSPIVKIGFKEVCGS